MKYFSMFSGIGTGEKGIEQAYRIYWSNRNPPNRDGGAGVTQSGSQATQSGVRFSGISADSFKSGDAGSLQCVGFSEIDRHAEAIYRFHYDHHNFGNATELVPESIPDFDFLIAGFPCQAFSIAGKRQGFDDARGTLFFEIARVLSHKRPAHFLLENVKGLSSHDSGRTVIEIHRILSGLGYYVERVLLNSKDYGVPQNRERLFFVGHLGNRCSREIFSFGNNGEFPAERQGQISPTVTSRYYKQGQSDPYVVSGIAGDAEREMNQLDETKGMADAHRVYEGDGLARTLKGEGGGLGAKTGLYTVSQLNPSTESGGKQPYQQNRVYDPNGITPALNAELSSGSYAIPVLTPDRPTKRQNGRRMKEDGDEAFTLTAQDRHGVFNGQRIRRLTPVECERLQGLTDNYTKFGRYGDEIKEVSDTQRYRGLGNAFTVNVIEALVTRMLEVGCLE